MSVLCALIEKGELDRSELAAAAPGVDLSVLDAPVDPDAWYPVDVFAQLIEFLWDKQGNREREFLIEAGRSTAERLTESGRFVVLRTEADSWGPSLVHVMTTVSARLYNFTEWRVWLTDDPGEFSLEVTDATDWPEPARIASEGFIALLCERTAQASRVTVSSRRITPDRVVYQIQIVS